MRARCKYVEVEGMDQGKREKLGGEETPDAYLIAALTLDSKTRSR